jgi:hypothetical protein
MRWSWASLPVVAMPLAAMSLPAQQVTEFGVQAIGTASDPALAVAAGYAGLRVSRRFRVSAAAGLGGSGGGTAWRGELLAHFLLAPRARRGLGGYAAGGIAAVGGPVDQGYLVLTLGIEARPGGRSGWFLEAGVGGGARLAAGYRWRHFPGLGAGTE